MRARRPPPPQTLLLRPPRRRLSRPSPAAPVESTSPTQVVPPASRRSAPTATARAKSSAPSWALLAIRASTQATNPSSGGRAPASVPSSRCAWALTSPGVRRTSPRSRRVSPARATAPGESSTARTRPPCSTSPPPSIQRPGSQSRLRAVRTTGSMQADLSETYGGSFPPPRIRAPPRRAADQFGWTPILRLVIPTTLSWIGP